MSFITKLQSVFGFGPDDDDELVDLEGEKYTAPAPVVNTVAAPTKTPVVKADTTSKVEVSDQMVLNIFDKVVEITNEYVPAYFAASLDIEKQKKYLYDSLDAATKQYLAALEAKAQEHCMALWQDERDKLKAEMDNQKQRARELEAKRAEINEQKLSADRQRRALSERVHDLEANIMQLEAEKEQLDIEKHSLLNKAKVANVYEADIESLRQQISELQSREPNAALTEENENLKSRVGELNAEIERLNEAVEAANVKSEMNGAMFSDMQKHNAESLKQSQDLADRIKQLEDELALRDAKIDDLNQTIQQRDAQIEEDQETIEAIEQIAEQIDLFESVKAKLDNRIAELKEELKNTQHENNTLRITIKNNIYAHAQQEKALMDQIEQLKGGSIQ